MPRYIIERDVAGIPAEELERLSKASIEVADAMDGVVWVKSYVSDAEGKVYCEYDAPSPDAIREHARRSGLPVGQISEVSMEVSPDMFR